VDSELAACYYTYAYMMIMKYVADGKYTISRSCYNRSTHE